MLLFLRTNAPWLGAGALLTFSSSYGQTFFISIFASQIKETFGLSDGQWGLIYTLGTTASAAVMIWAGVLTDRFRVRTLAMFVLPLLALSCVFMAINPVVWLLPAVIFLQRFAGQGMASHIASVAMARWFVASRGKALSIATLGYSIGEALLPMLFVALLAFFDWRFLWGLAAIMALLALPPILSMLHAERTPQSVATDRQTTGMQNRHWTRPEALRHWLFWMLIPVLLGPSTFGTAFLFQQVHFAEIKGWSHVSFVALFPIFTSVGILSMIASGIAIDRFGTTRMLPAIQLPMALGFFVLASVDTLFGAALGMALLGMTTGMNSTVTAAFWAETYGTKHLGAIKAMATAVMVLGSAIGPGLSGGLIDLGLTFDRQLPGFTAFFVVASFTTYLAIRWAEPLRANANV
jgi:MFS family permease